MISVTELTTLLVSKTTPVLIDVRDIDEYRTNHIPNSENIPLTELATAFAGIDVSKCIVFVCQTGVRSAQATSFAKSAGYKNALSLDGGMVAWLANATP